MTVTLQLPISYYFLNSVAAYIIHFHVIVSTCRQGKTLMSCSIIDLKVQCFYFRALY